MIGKTPPLNLVPIEQSEGLEANLPGKLEYFNPAGSIKDRIAKAMIDDAAASGKGKPGSVIIEPTSGNSKGLGQSEGVSLPVPRFGLRSNPPSGPKIEARTITALLPDTGDRYLSTPLFAD